MVLHSVCLEGDCVENKSLYVHFGGDFVMIDLISNWRQSFAAAIRGK